LRTVLSHDRQTQIGGWSEVMYALDFLRRWQGADPSPVETIDWVRDNRLGRLQSGEREWFESTFGLRAGDTPAR
jgi:hypothetical protein